MRNTKLLLLATLICIPGITRAVTVITSLPYTITKPGAYVLGRDLTAHGTDGIDVKASNVSINLNGYTLTGDQSNTGIFVESGNNFVIQNGTISGFGDGVYFYFASQEVVKNVKLLGIASTGVYLSGSDCLVEDCLIVGTGGAQSFGIYWSGSDVLIKHNQISEFWVGIFNAEISVGNAIIGNYDANCTFSGALLGPYDKYQGNITTNCSFTGGIAVGHENG